MITKRIIHTFNDHKEFLYQRADASQLTPAELAKRLLEDKKQQDDQKLVRNYLTQAVQDELNFSKVNKIKLMNDWRVIMRIAKIDEIRKFLDLYMQLFERQLDDKDAILQMLDRDIVEAEEHFNIALTNHFIHIKQLMSLQDSRVKGLFKEFDKDVGELEIEFKDEFDELEQNYNSEQNEILKMLNNIRDSYNEKINKLKLDFQELSNSQVQKINETYGRIQENIKKMGNGDNNRFSTEMNEIKQKADDKNKKDIAGIEQLNLLEK
jgi:hypothetical protein